MFHPQQPINHRHRSSSAPPIIVGRELNTNRVLSRHTHQTISPTRVPRQSASHLSIKSIVTFNSITSSSSWSKGSNSYYTSPSPTLQLTVNSPPTTSPKFKLSRVLCHSPPPVPLKTARRVHKDGRTWTRLLKLIKWLNFCPTTDDDSPSVSNVSVCPV